ncbi:unnamed protein product [Echinostoma caproni]|uniref:UBIQUITIN_CONJUGAT_2 domain-containing protein n=1 Tax=Echinostoma caproni TaxID=27848 RepID=A0A183A7G8_9TREM|nr:unnamed protein product [Echinostoma caproni]
MIPKRKIDWKNNALDILLGALSFSLQLRTTQLSLFSSAHRQNRVVVNARCRLNYRELVRWARSRERDETSETDSSYESIDPYLPQFCSVRLGGSPHHASGENETATDHESQDGAEKWTMNNMLHKCASLITSLGSNNPKDHPSGNAAAAGDQVSDGGCANTAVNDSMNSSNPPDTGARNSSTRKSRSASKGVGESEIDAIRLRESHLPPLRPGSWAPVAIYTTYTTYDVRWQDGTFEQNIPCQDLLPVYFNIDEHDFFPGSRLIPMGPPEEAGVYELVALVDRQLGYGDVLLMHTPNDPLHADLPAGYLEDIIPETCKLVIRWIDGLTTEVTRSECLFPLDALMDDDDWSDDDSDEFESDDLSTESDSEWSTVSSEVSFASSTSNKDRDDLLTADRPADRTQLTHDVGLNVELDEAESHEAAMKQAAMNVVLAYQRTEAARRLLVDRRTFVFWILRRFVVVPDELDTVVDQLGTLLAAAAVAPTLDDQDNVGSTDPNRCASSSVLSGSEQVSPVETDSGNKLPFAGRLLQPARAWDYAEETEAIQIVEKLLSIRELMRSAYQLVHDCRIKRMYTKCDHRELFSEKHVEGVLKSIEISGGTAMQAELSTASTLDALGAAMTYTNPSDATETSAPDVSISSSPQTLAMLALVLIVPNSTQPFTTSVDNWRDRIHYSLVKSESEDGTVTAYMLVSANLFDQLTHYLTMVHRRLLEQLADFEACALAWLGECAPDLVAKAKSLSSPDESDDTNTVNIELTKDSEDAQQSQEPILTSPKDTKEANQTTVKETASGEPVSNADAVASTARPTAVTEANACARSYSVPSVDEIPAQYRGQFIMEETAPSTHRFYRSQPNNLPKPFYKAWKRDNTLLSTSLPRGIIVKAFEDRIDLYSLMIVGSAGTPYEYGLFLFDVQLPAQYPSVPPQVHYYSFGSERVNPNLYVKGHVCLSLLGTWAGKDSENWSEENSNLLQLVVSLQGLILNSEPYFNEAGFEACRGNPESHERSRMYNESVVATLVQSMVQLLQNPEPVFRKEIIQHCITNAHSYGELLEFWSSLDEDEFNRLQNLQPSSNSDSAALQTKQNILPEFPLAPVSKGFQVSVRRHRLTFLSLVEASKLNEPG